MTGHRIQADLYRADQPADPGASGRIDPGERGMCLYNLTSAGAETRTLAAPTREGMVLTLTCGTYVGDIVITSAVAVNQTGNNTLTFGAARDTITLVSIKSGSTIYWSPVGNDGVALSTV